MEVGKENITDEDLYSLIIRLVHECGTHTLKELLIKVVQDLTSGEDEDLDKFLFSWSHVLYPCIRNDEQGRKRCRILFPGHNEKTDLAEWDLSLCALVLLKTCNLDKPLQGDVKRLREIRNKMCHIGSTAITRDQYQTYAVDIKCSVENICKFIGNEEFHSKVVEKFQSIQVLNVNYEKKGQNSDLGQGLSEEDGDALLYLEQLAATNVVQEQTRPQMLRLSLNNCPEDKHRELVSKFQEVVHEFKTETDCASLSAKQACEINSNVSAQSPSTSSSEHDDPLKRTFLSFLQKFSELGCNIDKVDEGSIILTVNCLTTKAFLFLCDMCITGQIYKLVYPLEEEIRHTYGIEYLDVRITAQKHSFVENIADISRQVASLKREQRATLPCPVKVKLTKPTMETYSDESAKNKLQIEFEINLPIYIDPGSVSNNFSKNQHRVCNEFAEVCRKELNISTLDVQFDLSPSKDINAERLSAAAEVQPLGSHSITSVAQHCCPGICNCTEKAYDLYHDQEHQNKQKADNTIIFTKEGLHEFVETGIKDQHKSILRSIQQPNAGCGHCLTANLFPCPTRGLCSHPRDCKFHDTPLKLPRACPNNVCDDMRQAIEDAHRFGKPSWKNTCASKWYKSHWEVAKCFLPPDGYQSIQSLTETDFNGTISLLLNCKEFTQRLSFDISQQPNQLTQARNVGREIRHSSNMKISGQQLAGYFQTMITLLEDKTCLANDECARKAVHRLKHLQEYTPPTEALNNMHTFWQVGPDFQRWYYEEFLKNDELQKSLKHAYDSQAWLQQQEDAYNFIKALSEDFYKSTNTSEDGTKEEKMKKVVIDTVPCEKIKSTFDCTFSPTVALKGTSGLDIAGIALLPDMLAVIDESKKLLLLVDAKSGDIWSQKTFSKRPRDVCELSDTEIVLCFPDDEELIVCQVQNGLINELTDHHKCVGKHCVGISCFSTSLVLVFEGEKAKIVVFDTKRDTVVSEFAMTQYEIPPKRAVATPDMATILFVTENAIQSLSIADSKMDVLQKGSDILTFCAGIDTSDRGDIFVCCTFDDRVCRLQYNERECDLYKLKNKENGRKIIREPTLVRFCKHTKRLYIAQQQSPHIVVFQVAS